ncbi:Recombination associated protein RdgC [Candidatus Electrothrix aarhusensis]
MDLIDLIEEKRFIGQEFLAWLWFKSEERGGSVELPGRGDIQVAFEKHMLLEYGEGPESEKLICRGLQTELREARAGLALGKKPEQARIKIGSDEYEFSITLTAATMEFRSVRLPKTAGAADGDGDDAESFEGQVLERISLFEDGIELVNELFRLFINIRASSSWSDELVKLRAWVHSGAELAGM